jgi:hypothetical protein
MNILIDECVDEQLGNSFSIHHCQTARFAGFAGLENDDLLDRAESRQYNVLIIVRSRLGVPAKSGWQEDRRQHPSRKIKSSQRASVACASLSGMPILDKTR